MSLKTTDKNTLALINEVEKRKKEIAKLERPNWKTNCSFTYVEGSANAINIHVESNVKNLVSMVGFLRDKHGSYYRAAEELGLDKVPQFVWSGFSVEDWVEDIKLRISKIEIASKKQKLEQLETRLNKIISPELRAKIELEEIAKELE